MKHAQVVSPLILWAAVIIIAFILIGWFFTTASPQAADAQALDHDLLQLQRYVRLACASDMYERAYNPFTEQGMLTVNASGVCITTDRTECFLPVCSLPDTSIDLADVIDVYVVNNGTAVLLR